MILKKDVCIVGGGPAGMTLGLMLARQGLDVLVLEKSATYQREFRGEFIAGGSVITLEKLGILKRLQDHGYLTIERLLAYDQGEPLLEIDFSALHFRHKFGIDLPQPVLLQSMLEESSKYSHFDHRMGTPCLQLLRHEGRVQGVAFLQEGERIEVHSTLVVGADGRYSQVRKMAHIEAVVMPQPRDLIWFKLKRPPDWLKAIQIKMNKNKHLILLPTFPDMLRVGLNIPKGGFKEARRKGFDHFLSEIIQLEPRLAGRIEADVKGWDDTVLLDIFTARVPRWSVDGLVLIGDAAHTASPVLGQGVNLAIQDAIELAPYITAFLRRYPGKILPREVLVGFERTRKRHIGFVRLFQTSQERMLAAGHPLSIALRRVRMRLINAFPWLTMRVMEKIVYYAHTSVGSPEAGIGCDGER